MTMPTDRLLADIEYLTNEIGCRPALSQEEAEAALWVKKRLLSLDLDIQEQAFYTSGRMIEQLGPIELVAILGLWMSNSDPRWQRWLGAGLAAWAGWNAQRVAQGQSSLFEMLLPQTRTHNVIAQIPSRQSPRERVVLIAHLDTDIQRFSSHPQVRSLLADSGKVLNWLTLTAALGGESTRTWLRKLVVSGLVAHVALLIADEFGAYIPGANDNGSGVALLLHLAEILVREPLQDTEVIVAFTCSDTLHERGSSELLQEYGEIWQDATWIVVDGVGAGELCWIPSTHDTKISQIMSKVARENPAWGIMGRELPIPSPLKPFDSPDLNATALMGYERVSGYPVAWRSANDTPDIIETASLERSFEFLKAVLHRIDSPTMASTQHKAFEVLAE